MNDLSRIKKEFPDYPLESIPEGIPDWLTPAPWHNDAMPIWGDDAHVEADVTREGVCLAIDYPDPGMRETAGEPRFSVWSVSAHGQQEGDTFATDDWEAALSELRRRRRMVEAA